MENQFSLKICCQTVEECRGGRTSCAKDSFQVFGENFAPRQRNLQKCLDFIGIDVNFQLPLLVFGNAIYAYKVSQSGIEQFCVFFFKFHLKENVQLLFIPRLRIQRSGERPVRFRTSKRNTPLSVFSLAEVHLRDYSQWCLFLGWGCRKLFDVY